MGRARREQRFRSPAGWRAGFASAAAAAALFAAPAAASAGGDPASLVDPFIGTGAGAPNFHTGGGAGNTFPGATRPFGMVQWSPDTYPSKVNTPGGYTYSDRRIAGFSLKHVSGAGCRIYQDVSFLPVAEEVRRSPAPPPDGGAPPYLARFSHRDEEARPGFYRVGLEPGSKDEVDVALTATPRTGAGLIRYPKSGPAGLLIDAGSSAAGNQQAEAEIRPRAREVSGTAASGRFCSGRNSYQVHFVAQFDRGFDSYGTWKRSRLRPGTAASSDSVPFGQVRPTSRRRPKRRSAQAGAFVSFGGGGRTVGVRVGLSFVSVEQARRNLRAETQGFRFEAARKAAEREWAEMLGRVQVEGGSDADRRRFYTAMYHVLLHPSAFSDVDGRYRGLDGKVHRAQGFTKYADFSGWDVYRSEVPLLAMLYPERASDLVSSLVVDQHDLGWLPRWPVASGESGTMVGDPSDPTIAGAYAFGARNFDLAAALGAMVHGATEYGEVPGYVERPGLPDYLRLGYLPWKGTNREPGAAGVWGPTATTLEYTLADFAIARVAAAACDQTTYSQMMARSGNWRNVFDQSAGLARPRLESGAFLPVGGESTDGFVEGSAGQYTWFVPHDVAGLIAAMGGPEAALQRLDHHFASLNAGPESEHAFLGNEPSLGAPWLYAWLGRPYRTQEIVRRALLELYDTSPGGFPGNDDLGQMSSWYVFGALGIYPAIPGTDVLVLGSPLFERVVLKLPGGELEIGGQGAARGSPYVQGLSLNGEPYERSWLPFSAVAGGGKLAFQLSDQPSPAWASDPGAAPPSFGPDTANGCGS